MPNPPLLRPLPGSLPLQSDDEEQQSCRDATPHWITVLFPGQPISTGTTWLKSYARVDIENADSRVRTIIDSAGLLWGGGDVADEQHVYDVLPGQTLSLRTVRVSHERIGWLADGRGPDAPFHGIVVCPDPA